MSFFAVDPRGLVGMTSETIELNAAADPHLGFDAKGLLADMYLSQDSLRTLAEETGGYAAVNANNVGAHSTGSFAPTARITSSATTRRTRDATDGFTRSKCE